MEVIPAINVTDLESAKEKLRILSEFLPKNSWVHLDVADARFTYNKTWGDPNVWPTLNTKSYKLEAHLMVEEPEKVAAEWLKAGAKRIIVHRETFKNGETGRKILEACRVHGTEAMLSINPETPVQELLEASGAFSEFQILAVTPGLAGQRFYPAAEEKVRQLRAQLPNAMIEVDGGINYETAKIAKSAGANIMVSANCIFWNANPKVAYETLKQIGTN